MSPIARVLFGVLGAVGLVAVLGACSGDSFDPQGREATEGRSAAQGAVERVLDQVVSGRAEHGRVRVDGCHEGQDNWKRTDENAWECRVAVAAVVDGAATRNAVGPTLVSLHERLLELNGQPTEPDGLLAVARDYWGKLNQRPGYGPEDLPLQVYTLGGVRVEVVSSAPDAEDLPETVSNPFGSGFGAEVMISEEGVAAASLSSARSSSAAQLLVIRVSAPYYVVPN